MRPSSASQFTSRCPAVPVEKNPHDTQRTQCPDATQSLCPLAAAAGILTRRGTMAAGTVRSASLGLSFCPRPVTHRSVR
eukprot:8567230-Pyramimonas_sp.AAC.1